MHFYCGHQEAAEEAHGHCSPQKVDFFVDCSPLEMHESHIPFSIVPQGNESLLVKLARLKSMYNISSVLEQVVLKFQMHLILFGL